MNSAEIRVSKMPEWWTVAPVGERRFLGSLARMMRSAKRSKSRDVAQAAVKWERALGCFIRVRLMGERRRGARRRWRMADGRWQMATGSAATGANGGN
jgi:hypothetical protein